jgi:hypothetical protein
MPIAAPRLGRYRSTMMRFALDMLRVIALAAAVCAAVPAAAADPVAPLDSPVGILGQLIIDQAGGRSLEAAREATGSDTNPYGLDETALLAAAGAGAISRDITGAAVKPNELSILPQFNTPGGKFIAKAETPPTIPFAFFKDGRCQAGYVAGFPAPSATYIADLTGKPCSAVAVDLRNADTYRLIQDALDLAPHDLSDAELEQVVRAAYTAASAHARANGNYFARDGAFEPLRDAVAAEVQKQDFLSVVVPEAPAENADAARTCLAAPGTELRIAVNPFGDGLSLVAVSSTRAFAYRYDPHESAEVAVVPAEDCLRATPR